MKTIINEINVYSFDELSNEAKEKCILDWYEHEDYPFLCDYIHDAITENLDTAKVFSSIKLQYSLSYCQGDGLSFSAEFDFEKWLERYAFQNFKKRALIAQYLVYVKANNGHYSYAHKTCVSWEDNCGLSYFSTNLSNLESLFLSIFEDIQNYYLDVCKQAEKYGYSELEYRMNNEFSELCEANMYNFDESGKMINL